MKDAITAVLGEYSQTLGASGEVVGGVANLDWNWIIGAVIFVLAVYSVFRIVGMVIGGKNR